VFVLSTVVFFFLVLLTAIDDAAETPDDKEGVTEYTFIYPQRFTQQQ
jgi:hypothetical protein